VVEVLVVVVGPALVAKHRVSVYVSVLMGKPLPVRPLSNDHPLVDNSGHDGVPSKIKEQPYGQHLHIKPIAAEHCSARSRQQASPG